MQLSKLTGTICSTMRKFTSSWRNADFDGLIGETSWQRVGSCRFEGGTGGGCRPVIPSELRLDMDQLSGPFDVSGDQGIS